MYWLHWSVRQLQLCLRWAIFRILGIEYTVERDNVGREWHTLKIDGVEMAVKMLERIW